VRTKKRDYDLGHVFQALSLARRRRLHLNLIEWTSLSDARLCEKIPVVLWIVHVHVP
jgi:hypothetical protein